MAVIGAATIALGDAPAAVPQGPLHLVPLPREITREAGAYPLVATLTVAENGLAEGATLTEFTKELQPYGIAVESASGTASVTLSRSDDAQLGDEGYTLDVDPDGGVAIKARGGAGFYYGFQTLAQLVIDDGLKQHALPTVHIIDWPQYTWRGIHLDVSRHFFAVPVVERYIELASRYKLNVFHWDLTNDQGWRIQIQRYPKLTSVGSCRAGTQVGDPDSTATDGKRYCGYYTQAQIREVVAYAHAHFMTVVPAIDIPGHSDAAIAAYPWLSCGPGPHAVWEMWGESKDIMCPTPATFAFVDDVIGEMARLFPGPYIHIGGDEVPYDEWKASPVVARLMQAQHLTSYVAVQGYFTRKVEAIAAKHGKRVVGWDEILAGGVSKSAVIMEWHGAHIDAAPKHGNDAVVVPDGRLYFDADQGSEDFEPQGIGGLTDLEMVYSFDPMPQGLTQEQARHVLGAQGNVWSEYIPTEDHLFFMLFPRALALSELCWTPRDEMGWPDFTSRIGPELVRLEREGLHYRIPDVTFGVSGATIELPEQQAARNYDDVRMNGAATITLTEVAPDAVIRYTTDGTMPTRYSPAYVAPLVVAPAGSQPAIVSAIAVLPDGRTSAPSFLRIGPTGP
ncbi:MAG TPA: family 20 glycosylhydrolase [Candidatus Eremiobacteraceae bacterium]|nr:family 20 glycosylhydrolase [Candidatus Eremiobacteraceae bacterium]